MLSPPAVVTTDAIPPARRTGRRLSAPSVALALVLAVGVTDRIWAWATGYGMWGDELYVAVNLRDRGFVGLTGPLEYSQVAPPGWLMLEKGVLLMFGSGERGPYACPSWCRPSPSWGWPAFCRTG